MIKLDPNKIPDSNEISSYTLFAAKEIIGSMLRGGGDFEVYEVENDEDYDVTTIKLRCDGLVFDVQINMAEISDSDDYERGDFDE